MPPSDQPSLFDQETAAQDSGGRFGQGVAVREVPCRSLLNRSGISDYSFNCYTGCAHGCVYCYARFMQRFHPHEEPWGSFVDVKVNSVDVLKRERRRLPPAAVFTCSACDGWQPLERQCGLTRRCCQLLLEAGFRLQVLSKSELVLRDLDIFAGRDVSIGVTITTSQEDQARLWEPKASSLAAQIRVLKLAKAAGLKTTVMFGPLLPEISDTPEALQRLFTLAAEANVDRIWTDALNARPRVWPAIQELLRKRRSELLELYHRVLFDQTFRDTYLGELHRRVHRAASETGLSQLLA